MPRDCGRDRVRDLAASTASAICRTYPPRPIVAEYDDVVARIPRRHKAKAQNAHANTRRALFDRRRRRRCCPPPWWSLPRWSLL
jgi:hypothetical protein